MAKVRAIGGIFFKSPDEKKLYEWYEKHLGIAAKPGEGVTFPWRRADDASQEEMTVWSIFPAATKYFKDSKAEFMVNYIVDDLDAILTELRAAGVAVDDNVESYEFGKFGWITDPDGNRIELWQPR